MDVIPGELLPLSILAVQLIIVVCVLIHSIIPQDTVPIPNRCG